MEELDLKNNAMILFDSYLEDGRKLLESLRKIGVDCPAAAIDDDGFLPDGVESVYGSFLGEYEKSEEIPGRPRYFNEVKVPDYWEISGNNSSGQIHDLYRLRGKIFYTEPAHKRLVKVVDWYDERGTVRSCDHYNKYGALYARTIFNARGQKVNKSYFDAKGREIIVENYVTRHITLNEGSMVKIFRNKTDFVIYYMKVNGLESRNLLFNSLSVPFFVSERLDKTDGQDILFWQEPVGSEIPGNMQIILQDRSNRTRHIFVQKSDAYEKLLALGAPSEKLHKLGYIYQYERKNTFGKDVLICTNSENVAHAHQITKALPQLHFHIAAITEMSTKLLTVGAYDNVTMYPCVKTSILDELFHKCDLYLDINHEGEIVSAVSRAFLNDQLIYAFKETLHNTVYVAKEHIYAEDNVKELIAQLQRVTQDAAYMEQELDVQKAGALAETEEHFKEIIENMELLW